MLGHLITIPILINWLLALPEKNIRKWLSWESAPDPRCGGRRRCRMAVRQSNQRAGGWDAAGTGRTAWSGSGRQRRVGQGGRRHGGLERGAIADPPRPRLLTGGHYCDSGKRWESAGKPGSVEGNHPSGTRVAARLERPTRKPPRAAGADPATRTLPYLALLQVGFAVPPNVATGAVRSYRTLSPLPAGLRRHRRFAFCCTFRGLAPPRRYLAPCSMEPGLSSAKFRSDCLADSRAQYTARGARRPQSFGSSASARS